MAFFGMRIVNMRPARHTIEKRLLPSRHSPLILSRPLIPTYVPISTALPWNAKPYL